jgi:hypothetical protein
MITESKNNMCFLKSLKLQDEAEKKNSVHMFYLYVKLVILSSCYSQFILDKVTFFSLLSLS